MFIIGLTGGIATGKSLVSSMIKEFGVPVIDADKIAHELTQPGQPAYRNIINTFGEDIITENGEINRAKLGAIIFSNEDKRKELNKITHPVIAWEMKKRIGRLLLNGEQFVVLEVPLLFEFRSRNLFRSLYKTVVVSCNADLQLQRLMSRNNFTENDAKQRISCQVPLEKKTAVADFVIENSSTISNTRQQVENIVKLLRSSKRHIRNRIVYGIPLVVGGIGVLFLIIWILKFLVY